MATEPEDLEKLVQKKAKKPKRTVPQGKRLMTAEQYLKKAVKDQAVSDLIRSLHKTKIMSFADWGKETAAVLKKNVW
jgi:hypothetical protein